MTRRSRAREVALQLLFQREHNPGIERGDIVRFTEERLREPELREFCLALYDGVIGQQGVIDEKLAAAAENWRLSRMPTVDRNLLRLGAYEMLMYQHTPAAVVLDEVIELARRFGAAESSAFVNGVLDRLRRDAAAQPPPA
jgi:N utilization substance protein B